MRPGPELYAHNRRRVAERSEWPADALDLCERIDRINPGWYTTYRHAWTAVDGRPRPSGFYAQHDHHAHLEGELYGQTAGDLQAAILCHRCR